VGRRAPEPARGMPLVARLALVVAVAALAVVVVSTVTGTLPRVVSSVGSALGGISESVLRTPVPSVSLAPIPSAPTLVSPENPYTNKPTATISGTVPLEVVGRDGYVVRLYVALPDQAPVAVRDIAVGETTSFVVDDLPLEPGRNDVSATLVGSGGESEPSPVVTYVLDTSKPKITITSPRNKATVNGATVTITGKTQGRCTVVARNEANGTAATTSAADNGSFTLDVPLSSGTNGIALTATDLAGNVGSAVLSVRRGSGKLNVAMSASAYRISAARLPRSIELRAQVTDPNARLLAGQAVTFTLTIPGVPAITGDDVTDGSGTATFTTTIPAGATQGTGLATAFVSTADFGDASGRVSVTIIK
jgi:Glucodextranase, domain B